MRARPAPAPGTPSVSAEETRYSMYPSPRRRFCTSSLEVLLSSGGRIFLTSFSSMWVTNSSMDSYPAASEHCLTFSSSSPSILTLYEPNIFLPVAVPSLRSLCRSFSFAPLGLALVPLSTHGLRRGLNSCAASRLNSVSPGSSVPGFHIPPLRGYRLSEIAFLRLHSTLAQDALPHHHFGLCDSELGQDGGRDVGQGRRLRVNLAIAQQHARHLRIVHAMVAAPCVRIVFEYVGGERAQNRLPSRTIPAVVPYQRVRAAARVRALVGFAGQIDAGNHRRVILRVANLEK